MGHRVRSRKQYVPIHSLKYSFLKKVFKENIISTYKIDRFDFVRECYEEVLKRW